MAKIQEKHLMITLSKLVKDDEVKEIVLSEELLSSLEAIVQELVAADLIVEINVP